MDVAASPSSVLVLRVNRTALDLGNDLTHHRRYGDRADQERNYDYCSTGKLPNAALSPTSKLSGGPAGGATVSFSGLLGRPPRDFRGAAAMQPVDAGRPLRGRML